SRRDRRSDRTVVRDAKYKSLFAFHASHKSLSSRSWLLPSFRPEDTRAHRAPQRRRWRVGSKDSRQSDGNQQRCSTGRKGPDVERSLRVRLLKSPTSSGPGHHLFHSMMMFGSLMVSESWWITALILLYP